MCTITAYLQEGTQGLSFLLSAPLPSLTSVNGSISTIPTFCSPHRLVNTIPPSSSSHSPHHAKHLVILILLAILILSILIILTMSGPGVTVTDRMDVDASNLSLPDESPALERMWKPPEEEEVIEDADSESFEEACLRGCCEETLKGDQCRTPEACSHRLLVCQDFGTPGRVSNVLLSDNLVLMIRRHASTLTRYTIGKLCIYEYHARLSLRILPCRTRAQTANRATITRTFESVVVKSLVATNGRRSRLRRETRRDTKKVRKEERRKGTRVMSRIVIMLRGERRARSEEAW